MHVSLLLLFVILVLYSASAVTTELDSEYYFIHRFEIHSDTVPVQVCYHMFFVCRLRSVRRLSLFIHCILSQFLTSIEKSFSANIEIKTQKLYIRPNVRVGTSPSDG